MKKIIVFLLLLGATVALLWWLGKENENNDLVILTYDQEIPNVNIDITRIIESIDQSTEINASEEKPEEERIFSLKDLLVAKTEAEEGVYEEKMKKILSPLKNQALNEGRVVIDVLNNKDQEALEGIEETRLIYKKITEELLLVLVPEEALKVHLDILSLSEKISFNLSKMQQILSQPLMALENTELYYKNIKSMHRASVNLNLILNQSENAESI